VTNETNLPIEDRSPGAPDPAARHAILQQLLKAANEEEWLDVTQAALQTGLPLDQLRDLLDLAENIRRTA
jgi:hypothetical protein